MQSTRPPDSFIVTVTPATPAAERTVADVIVGALAITAALLLVAVVMGGLFGVIRLGWLKRHPPDADHMPPVRPSASDPRMPPPPAQ